MTTVFFSVLLAVAVALREDVVRKVVTSRADGDDLPGVPHLSSDFDFSGVAQLPPNIELPPLHQPGPVQQGVLSMPGAQIHGVMQAPAEPPSWTTFEKQQVEMQIKLRDELLHRQNARIQQLEGDLSRALYAHELQQAEIERLTAMLTKAPGKEDKQPRYWTPEEHQKFVEAVQLYGEKDVKAISKYVGTRTPTQTRTHMQKIALRAASGDGKKGGLPAKVPQTGVPRSVTSDSDATDATDVATDTSSEYDIDAARQKSALPYSVTALPYPVSEMSIAAGSTAPPP